MEMKDMVDREQALALLHEHVKSESLRKHCLAVETVMRAYARKFEADEELWGVAGLLHDFDYEEYPNAEQHPFMGVGWLKELGYPVELTDAILAHADYSGVPRDRPIRVALFASDELAGFVMAVARVRPNQSLAEVDVRAVRKKLKDKAFAAAISRADIEQGAVELGVPLDEHIAFVVQALQGNATALGLA
jgi:putative nucleotidyltransferase with HDIG domain